MSDSALKVIVLQCVDARVCNLSYRIYTSRSVDASVDASVDFLGGDFRYFDEECVVAVKIITCTKHWYLPYTFNVIHTHLV